MPGPLGRDDERTKARSQPRLEVIRTGEADRADTLAEVRKLAQFNGRAAAMGFCVEVHIFPGVNHGYMMPSNPNAFHKATRVFSMERALSILNGLTDEPPRRAG